MTSPPRQRWLRVVTVVVLVAAFAGALFTYEHFFREQPAPGYESDEDHFLFGSIGTETSDGVPYWIWLVLPRIFPDLLPGPGGYSSLGVLAKEGAELPVGFSRVTVGYPRVGTNCALCHAASVRTAAGEPPVLVPGAPSHHAVGPAYRRFLAAAAADPRFTATTILAEIAKNYRLPLTERLLYRFVIIPSTKRDLRALGDEPPFSLVHGADPLPLWTTGPGTGRPYGWTGFNTDVDEVVVAQAVHAGSSAAWIDRDHLRWDRGEGAETSSLRRVMRYMAARRPPPFPGAVDRGLADEGAALFREACAGCHSPDGERARAVVPVAEVGTDRGRADAWTADAAAALNALAAGRAWSFSKFTASGGYVAVPLDGLWLRGPYLHNGSVPSLADLLQPAGLRPSRFWRGSDVFDPVQVGFVSDGDASGRAGTLFDTTRPGNGNGGHFYGTELPPDDKRALLEYLKTL